MSKDTCNTDGPHLDPVSMVGFLLALREQGDCSSIHAANAFLVIAAHPEGLRTLEIAASIEAASIPTASSTLQKLGIAGLIYYTLKPRCTLWKLTPKGRALADRFLKTNHPDA